MKAAAGAITLAELASALGYPAEESSIVAELKAGSEDAYAWLVCHYHQPVYSLIFRMVNDPADAADTTQEVFIKIFRGIKRFNGQSSLKTWVYRIAVHEACNRKRWWFRHKSREVALEPAARDSESCSTALMETLHDEALSPFDSVARREVRERVEKQLSRVPEPYRTVVILREIEELSYEEIADVMQISLGTVKSRLLRGREALKKLLSPYLEMRGASCAEIKVAGYEAETNNSDENISMEKISIVGAREVEVHS